MAESPQFLVFRSLPAGQPTPTGIINDVADLHYFLDRELQELSAANEASSEEARDAHHALAEAYRALARQSDPCRGPRREPGL